MKSHPNKTHVRIRIGPSTRNDYTRFRQELRDKYKVTWSGFGGYTEIKGDSIDINVFRNDKYLHLVLYGNKKTRIKIIGILMNHAEFAKWK